MSKTTVDKFKELLEEGDRKCSYAKCHEPIPCEWLENRYGHDLCNYKEGCVRLQGGMRSANNLFGGFDFSHFPKVPSSEIRFPELKCPYCGEALVASDMEDGVKPYCPKCKIRGDELFGDLMKVSKK